MYCSSLTFTIFILCLQVTSSATINSGNSLSIFNATQDQGYTFRRYQTGCIDTPDWMGPGRPRSFKFSDCGQATRQIKAKMDEYGAQLFNFLALGAQSEPYWAIFPPIETPFRIVKGKSSLDSDECIEATLLHVSN